MPGGDRSGPMGEGPRTGRGMGYCSGYEGPSYTRPGPGYGYGRGFGPGFGRGFGPGFGWGRGWRHRAYATGWARWDYGPAWGAPPTREDEAAFLKDQAEGLQTELDAIKRRLTELEEE